MRLNASGAHLWMALKAHSWQEKAERWEARLEAGALAALHDPGSCAVWGGFKSMHAHTVRQQKKGL